MECGQDVAVDNVEDTDGAKWLVQRGTTPSISKLEQTLDAIKGLRPAVGPLVDGPLTIMY